MGNGLGIIALNSVIFMWQCTSKRKISRFIHNKDPHRHTVYVSPSSLIMRVLVLGGTGLVGIQLSRECLSVFHCSLILFVRSPEKIPEDLASNSAVIVIQGQLNDQDALSKAMEGVDVVLSALGPSVKKGPFHPSGTPLAHAFSSIIQLMHQHQIKRLIALGTASITDPADKFSLQYSVLVNGVAVFARNAYLDVVAIGETIRRDGADLDWTIVRVPLLNNHASKEVIAGYIGDGKTKSTSLSRAGFAAFVTAEIDKRAWVQKAPLICSS